MSARFDIGGEMSAEISLDEDAPQSAQIAFLRAFTFLFIEQAVVLVMRATIDRTLGEVLNGKRN